MYISLHLTIMVILNLPLTLPSFIAQLSTKDVTVTCEYAKEGHPPFPEITDCIAIQNRDLPRDPGDLSNKPVWKPTNPTKAIYRVPQTFRHRTCAVELILLHGVREERGYWSDANDRMASLDAACWGHRWPPPKKDFLGGFIRFGDNGNLQLHIQYNGPPLLQKNNTLVSIAELNTS